MATKAERVYAQAVEAARAAMTDTLAWLLTDEARDHRVCGCPSAREMAAAARRRGWEVGLGVLDELRLPKKAARALADRLCAEVGCDPSGDADDIPDEVAAAFAELRRREDNLAGLMRLRDALMLERARPAGE